MPHETILVDVDGPVATVTLHRPDRLNAYTARMGAELFGALHELDVRDDVRAIVVTGAGRAFCAGADLEPGGATFARERAWSEAAENEAKVRPWNMRTPVIAALNGPAVGIGATLPLWWDVRIASERAKIAFLFVRRGIVPEAGSTWILPRLVGLSRAMDWMLTGRTVSADEALACGLVSRVVPHDDLLPVAREMGREIARAAAPVAVAVARRLLWRQLMEDDPRRAKALEDDLFLWIGRHPDAAEGVLAFLQKRDAAWTGSAARDLPEAIADLDPTPPARPPIR